MNLNKEEIRSDGSLDYESPKRNQMECGPILGPVVTAVFDDIESYITHHVRHCDCVVGCVAWLTSEPILRALAEVSYVSIIVQKEDFLRPDSGGWWPGKLRKLYEEIPSNMNRLQYGLQETVVGSLSYAGDPTISSVRCCGEASGSKKYIKPRAHHKFAVLCDVVETEDPPTWTSQKYVPRSVITGSYNWTNNATNSLENIVHIYDANISTAFFNEWAYVAALSEPLDWHSSWMCPEWRVGS